MGGRKSGRCPEGKHNTVNSEDGGIYLQFLRVTVVVVVGFCRVGRGWGGGGKYTLDTGKGMLKIK